MNAENPMNRTFFLLLLAALVSTATSGWTLSIFMVKHPDGSTTVIDPYNGNRYTTRDPRAVVAYIYKKGRVEGFGNSISQNQFAQPPATPAQTAVGHVKTYETAAIKDVSRLPGSSIVLNPIRRLFSTINNAVAAPVRQ
jgi:hypothetical protein